MIGLLALDLDGTTLNDSGELTQKNKDALQLAREKGYITCFATGRRDVDMRPLESIVHVVDYLLLNNGGKIIRTKDHAILSNQIIEPSIVGTLTAFCIERGLQIHAEGMSSWWCNYLSKETQKYGEYLKTLPQILDTPQDFMSKNVEGMMVTVQARQVVDWIIATSLPVEVLFSEETVADIMAKGVSKANGIATLLRHLSVVNPHVVAVGNYDNDCEMIEKATLGVAVANATEPLKQIANAVTHATNNQDAIMEVVHRFL